VRAQPGGNLRRHLDRPLVLAPDRGTRRSGKDAPGFSPRPGEGRRFRMPRTRGHGQAQRILRPAACGHLGPARFHGRPQAAPGHGHRPHVLSGRHLRRRIRGLYPLLLLHLRDRERSRAQARPQGGHPRRWPQPHRPGHRVRLLLLSCLLCASRAWRAVHHGQLQPRDGFHRL